MSAVEFAYLSAEHVGDAANVLVTGHTSHLFAHIFGVDFERTRAMLHRMLAQEKLWLAPIVAMADGKLVGVLIGERAIVEYAPLRNGAPQTIAMERFWAVSHDAPRETHGGLVAWFSKWAAIDPNTAVDVISLPAGQHDGPQARWLRATGGFMEAETLFVATRETRRN